MRALALALAASLLAACSSDDGGDASDTPSMPHLPRPGEAGELWLSQTGLYRDIESKQVAPDLREFVPAFPLWSDGLDKRRWLRLPPGARIDTTDMDHWQFPAGTMVFKEFSQGGRRIETRLIARTGSGPRDYWMGAFVWNDDESDARFVPQGQVDARGTQHDVPNIKNCATCHNGEPGRVLGFSAVQQPGVAPALLSEPPPRPFAPPGDAATSAALGYLHANCGNCHNPHGSARPDTDLDLRLSVADRTPEVTAAYRTAVGKPLQSLQATPFRLRIKPRAPESSALLHRMTERGTRSQMPPLATEKVDRAGLDMVRAWIDAL